MSSLGWRCLYWAPRGLGCLLTALLILFALDVFQEEYGPTDTLVALLIHLVPAVVLAAALILSWNQEWIGGFLFGGLGVFYILWTLGDVHWTAWLALSGPAILIGALFGLCWRWREPIRRARRGRAAPRSTGRNSVPPAEENPLHERLAMLKKIGLIAAVVLVALQFVPVDRDNPPEAAPFAGPAPVQEILARSCFDCHSNRTVWPWYAKVAPVSFLVAHDVAEGRGKLNFSDWGALAPAKQAHAAEEMLEEIREGKMPLPIYKPLHRGAALTPAQVAVLADWAQREFGGTAAEH